MKNKFLEAFYGMEEEDATKQIGVFLDTIKINIEGIELTPKGIKSVLDHIKTLTVSNTEVNNEVQ